jgi:hypothetical protein
MEPAEVFRSWGQRYDLKIFSTKIGEKIKGTEFCVK